MSDLDDLNFLNEMGVDNYYENVNMIDLVDLVENPERKYTVHERVDPFDLYL